MTPQEITLVQNSFTQLKPIAATVSRLFYDRLFTLDPNLRPLFKGDLAQQGHKLMTMLQVTVQGLTRLDTLTPVVRQLGARHATYGVEDSHYATVGSALLWTLEQGLGAAWKPDVQAAWETAYSLLADVMQFGAMEAASNIK